MEPKARKTTLTKKQKETLDFIKDFLIRNGQPPTMAEMSKELNLRSLRSVTQRLEALEAKGFIKRDRFTHRGISLLDPFSSSFPTGTIKIPVIASAGCDAMQVYAQQRYDEYLAIDKGFVDDRKDIVAIKAVGNSMMDANIQNGDYVLVEVTGDVTNGDLVVAIFGDMAVIKRLKQVPGATILEPEARGRGYSPIIVDEHFSKIFGKVLRVVPVSTGSEEIEQIPEEQIYGSSYHLSFERF